MGKKLKLLQKISDQLEEMNDLLALNLSKLNNYEIRVNYPSTVSDEDIDKIEKFYEGFADALDNAYGKIDKKDATPLSALEDDEEPEINYLRDKLLEQTEEEILKTQLILPNMGYTIDTVPSVLHNNGYVTFDPHSLNNVSDYHKLVNFIERDIDMGTDTVNYQETIHSMLTAYKLGRRILYYTEISNES